MLKASDSDTDITGKGNKDKKSTSCTKIVVRRLPPSWTTEDFVENFSPFPDNDYFSFVKADYSFGKDAFSRAYINFVNLDDLYNFRDKFDDFLFVDPKGDEYPAVVEFAPCQKIPRRKTKKVDLKSGTLYQDADYLKFLETLENPVVEEPQSMESTIEELEAKERNNKSYANTKTPLTEYIKRKREERRLAILRNREDRRRRELERRKIPQEKRRKDTQGRFQSKEKSADRDSEKSKIADKEKLRFSKENRDKSSKDKSSSNLKETKEQESSGKASKSASNESKVTSSDLSSQSNKRLNEGRSYKADRRPLNSADKVKSTGDNKGPGKKTTSSKDDPIIRPSIDNKKNSEYRSTSKSKDDASSSVHFRGSLTKEVVTQLETSSLKDKLLESSMDDIQEHTHEVVDSPKTISVTEQEDDSKSVASTDLPDENAEMQASAESIRSTDSQAETSDNRKRRKDRPEKALYVPRRAREATNKRDDKNVNL